jgi:hypothetical protein
MADWAFVLTPLLVLPIVLLFRFVGCGLDVVGSAEPPLETFPDPKPPAQKPPADPPVLVPEPPPEYKGTILLETSVRAYWRLVDGVGATVAQDEKGFKHGDYKENYMLPQVAPTATTAGSEGRNPALLKTGQSSLLDSDSKMCRFFDGGHVLVGPGLFTDQFTIEAWVRAEAFSPEYEYTLFDVGGRYAVPPSAAADRGFRLFVNRQKRWQVRLGQNPADLFPNPQLVPLGNRTHIALTVGNAGAGGMQKQFSLYGDGKLLGSVSVSTYNRPDGAPLFIGIANEQANPANTPILRYPALCRIQEVVLHNQALSQGVIQNHVVINR